MHISAPFIHRPVATSLLSAAILLAGGIGFYFLPVAPLPQIDFPTISIFAKLPGASPETMASSVATPLERQFGRIAGITEMTSSSQLGSSNVTLQFELDRDINAASRDVQAAINASAGQLPVGLPSLPTYRKVNPNDAPIMALSLYSDTIPRSHLYDYSDSILAQKLSQVSGVGQVQIYGGAQPAVRVDVNPNALAHYGIGLEDVRAALQTANANTPKGNLEDLGNRWILSASDQLFINPEEYMPLIVAYRNGAPVRLKDIAVVTEGIADLRNSGYANGKPAVSLNISRQPGANIIKTVDLIKALLPELRASIPPSATIEITSDRTTTIRASVEDIEFTLMLTVVLVVMVIFLFLRNVWATIIPSISVPLSIVGTFGVMYLLHYSIDNLSLMAMAICTGFVVDDAIVVIENISRYLELGYSPLEAAMKGSLEIGFTVLSMSLSLIAVFIPILLMGGIVGRLFREFAVTLSVAIAVSLCVSLTTTPMMCALFLKSEKDIKHGKLFRASERVFQWSLDTYAAGLRWVLGQQPFMLIVTVATICLSIYLYIIIPKGFFPQQDTGRMTGSILGAQDLSFPAMQQKLKQYTDIVMNDPAVFSMSSSTGGGAENTGNMNVDLKPVGQRITVDQVIARLRRKLAVVPGATLFLRANQDITVGGRFTSAQYQYTLESENLNDLEVWAPRVEAKMRQLRGLRDIASDQQTRGLQATLVIDRDTASRLGIASATIDNTLYDAFGQRQVSTIFTQLNEYHVVMEVDSAFRDSTDAIQSLYVRSINGAQVPLSAFTHFEMKTTALAVNHQGQFPAVTISFNLGEGVALGDAVRDIEAAVLQLGIPSDIRPSFQGTAQAFQSSLATQPWLILAALVAVYIVLGVLYESYIHPITILSTLPSAGVGALLALLAFHTELSVIALIGIILLIGIVKKNAIMMIDFAVEAERSGKTQVEAIYQACLLRFRPIMMTTMAALFGGLPLALATGTGAEMRRPLGISIVGGLMVSQALTLFTTPVIYLYMDRLRLMMKRRKETHVIHGEVSPPSAPIKDPSVP